MIRCTSQSHGRRHVHGSECRGALVALLNAIGSGEFRNERERTFTTVQSNVVSSGSLSGSSALAALNTVVRTHGHHNWGGGIVQPQRREKFPRILRHTFDGAGTAGQFGAT
jgi:hypothetical protein